MGHCQYETTTDTPTSKLDKVVPFSSKRDILLKLYASGSSCDTKCFGNQ